MRSRRRALLRLPATVRRPARGGLVLAGRARQTVRAAGLRAATRCRCARVQSLRELLERCQPGTRQRRHLPRLHPVARALALPLPARSRTGAAGSTACTRTLTRDDDPARPCRILPSRDSSAFVTYLGCAAGATSRATTRSGAAPPRRSMRASSALPAQGQLRRRLGPPPMHWPTRELAEARDTEQRYDRDTGRAHAGRLAQ